MPTKTVQKRRETLPTIHQAIDQVINGSISTDDLHSILDFMERIEKRNAEKAFNDALRKAQAEFPLMPKPFSRPVSKDNPKQIPYNNMSVVGPIIDPILHKVGLSYHYVARMIEGTPWFFCVARHIDGHSEEAGIPMYADSSNGRMNPLQEQASGLSYQQRFTNRMMFGWESEGGEDDDASSIGKPAGEDIQNWFNGLVAVMPENMKASWTGRVEALGGLEKMQHDAVATWINLIKTEILRTGDTDLIRKANEVHAKYEQ